MSVALIALGANLGPREETLRSAVNSLAQLGHLEPPRVSQFYRSSPIGGPSGQGEFLNAAVRLETSLTPEELLASLQEIEIALGRQRHERWDARTIDLDLLLFDEAVIETPQLTVPHPRLAFRRFMAEPAAEIAPGMQHPTLGMSLAELAAHLQNAFPLVAIHAADARVAQNFAQELAAATGGECLPVVGSSLPTEVSAGRRESAAIEFLEQRAQQLADLIARDPTQPVIVPFWLEALRRQAADWAGGSVDFAEHAVAGAMQPKLLVWLESAGQPFHQPPRLPAVRVNAESPIEAREEAAAAVRAMQSPLIL